MQNAFAALQRGDWREAERLCREALKAQQDNLDALNLLGIITAQTGRGEEAVDLLSRLVAAVPNAAPAHFNLGAAYWVSKRTAEALESYERALVLNPNYAEVYNNRGVALASLQRHAEALESFERAIALMPLYPDAFYNRGDTLRALKRDAEAVASYQRAITLKPDYVDAHNNCGLALMRLRRNGEALASYERALALRPDYAEVNLNRGVVLLELHRPEEALACYEKAIAVKPDYAESYDNRGIALRCLGRHAEALQSHERAVALRPDLAEAHFNLAIQLLLLGDFARGWSEYEWRWQSSQFSNRRRAFAQPLWLGAQTITGKTILLHGEQGLGDTLQFCRYVKRVAELGAEVILEVQPALLAALSNLEGAARVLPAGASLPPFDYHCPLVSLPLAFKTRLDSIPNAVAYIRCNREMSAQWSQKLGKRKFPRVGLVWSGGFRPGEPKAWSERRNISLSRLEGLNIPNVEFYSLQKGEDGAEQLTKLREAGWKGPRIIDHTEDLNDFSDTVALIDNLDLVISVDTSTAHLAAAMGKPTWILNRYDTCWRWLLDRSDSPWYPAARLFRQSTFNDWTNVVLEVRQGLIALANRLRS